MKDLGQLIYSINPNKDVRKHAPVEFHMDPYFHVSLFADMTKSRVVLHHLQEGEQDVNQGLPSFQETIVYDGQKDTFNIETQESPGFVDNDDSNTVNVVFDRNHYMVVNQNQVSESALNEPEPTTSKKKARKRKKSNK